MGNRRMLFFILCITLHGVVTPYRIISFVLVSPAFIR